MIKANRLEDLKSLSIVKVYTRDILNSITVGQAWAGKQHMRDFTIFTAVALIKLKNCCPHSFTGYQIHRFLPRKVTAMFGGKMAG